MNGGWLSTATMRADELCTSTTVWAPVPQPMSSTRVRGPTSGTSPRARRVLAAVPGPCRGSPLNSSKNSAAARSGSMAYSRCSLAGPADLAKPIILGLVSWKVPIARQTTNRQTANSMRPAGV